MARPTTKTDLIFIANHQFTKLMKMIDDMSPEEQASQFNFSPEFLEKKKETHWKRDQNLCDVLVHLYEWHQLLLNWVTTNQQGEVVPFLPAPYNWRTYGQLNVDFIKKHQKTTLDQAKTWLEQSHKAVIKLIDSFNNEELFAKNQLVWTGNSPLGSYCVSATSSHYDWAIKKLKQSHKIWLKSQHE